MSRIRRLAALEQMSGVGVVDPPAHGGRAPEDLPIFPLLSGLAFLDDFADLDEILSTMAPDDCRDCRRHLARTNLYYLLRYELRRADVEDQWILDRCREIQAAPNGHLDLWAREHYKSTVITFAKTIQDILASHGDHPLPEWNGVEPTFGIFSHTRPIAKGFLRQIKQEFEQNDDLKALFPDVLYADPRKQSPKWSEDDGIVVRRKGNPKESTVEAWGLVDGQPTSKHFFIRIYDDVVTEASVTTADMIQKTTRRWELSLNLGVDGGHARYVGTRYDEIDTYNTMLEREVAVPRIHPATDDGQVSGKPVLFSQKAWDERVKWTSAYILSCQMLQNPTPDENAYFRQEEGVTIRWYDPQDPPKHARNYGATDGAVSKDGGDWTVHMPFGVDPNDDIYIWDVWRKQEDSDEWVDVQIELARRYRPMRWFGEGGVIEKAVGPFRRKRMRELGYYFTYETLPSIQDKETRAIAFQGRWNQGKVFLPRGAAWVPDFLLELRRFPNSTVDDQVDTLSLIGRALDDIRPGTVPQDEPPQKRDYSDWRFEKEQREARQAQPTNRLGLSRIPPGGDWRTMGLRRRK